MPITDNLIYEVLDDDKLPPAEKERNFLHECVTWLMHKVDNEKRKPEDVEKFPDFYNCSRKSRF